MVCTLGFLNRTGLGYLSQIYKDYQSFTEWTDNGKFNNKRHLLGFNVEQLKMTREKSFTAKIIEIEKQLENEHNLTEDEVWHLDQELVKILKNRDDALSQENLEMGLEEDKKRVFENMKKEDGTMAIPRMAKAYREQLQKVQKGELPDSMEPKVVEGGVKANGEDLSDSTKYMAVEGRVKAIGVWDTVGSLGIPKMPWDLWKGRRSVDELRFTSLNIHPNVEHAFHGLALDEWRTAFAPTLWRRKEHNNVTKLRQVWFPGCHSNVGGGSNSQQISKIALAWMADQLSSVGVEFSKTEMKRIFSTLSHGDELRPWGLGKITSPESLATTLPDRVWSTLTLPYRAYIRDLTESSIRTPGLYRNDKESRRLTNTDEWVHPSVRIRYLYHGLGLDDEDEWRCKALSGRGWQLKLVEKAPDAKDIRQGRDINVLDQYKTIGGSVTAVHDQYPKSHDESETLVRTEHPPEADLKQLAVPKSTWTWVNSEFSEARPLKEEHIGMWERMYIEINEKLVSAKVKSQHGRETTPTPIDRLRGLATLGTAKWIMETSLATIFGAAPQKLFPEKYPTHYGYHDFVSWQKGLSPVAESVAPHKLREGEALSSPLNDGT
ncbi:uncharacterized protein ColSpa_10024 [Colletotrichum spaethianum]|uniref:T6SS Phospholipase effector Tle1-like catalytic domain-containing protein n=1 Tax=Colletotrichum spaethianum TaxID=700344 RepID=A0AA37PCR9_9PEZI|nr:uncharacterized protein ColSpa_10024 [Colletotrichum spaethianum]GKT49843.1 hypothetical protein ColSpa_10024 [Colletotrichum spaethianum]